MQKELIPHLFKTEYRKIISVLCKLFGIVHIEIAEDITNDTFLLATETWGLKGVPQNPTAWLYTVAKNKTKDYFKRNKIFIDKIAVEIKNSQSNSDELEIDLSNKNINDSQLQMMFAICNPLISKETQIGLALRILCGFGIDEIAGAFLTNKEVINKRLYRGKEKLRLANIKIELPNEKEIEKRLASVLSTIYLLFNEGYYVSYQNLIIKKELCLEAMRLNYLLLKNIKTNTPKVNALMSLMCFHSSRFNARTDEKGGLILYNNQNKDNWDKELIDKGKYYLNLSSKGNEISKYHLEAAIAFWHSQNIDATIKWENILQLYNQLLQIEYSPIAALNRTYALSIVYNKTLAIKEALKIELKNNHLYHCLLAELYNDIDSKKVIYHLEKALKIAKNKNEKKMISNNLKNAKCGQKLT